MSSLFVTAINLKVHLVRQTGASKKIIKNQPSPSSQHPCRIGAKADLLQRWWVSKDNWTLKGWQTRRGGRVSSRNAPLKRDRVVEIRHLNIFRTQTSLLINVKVNWTVSKIRLLSRNRSQNYCKYIHLEKKDTFSWRLLWYSTMRYYPSHLCHQWLRGWSFLYSVIHCHTHDAVCW